MYRLEYETIEKGKHEGSVGTDDEDSSWTHIDFNFDIIFVLWCNLLDTQFASQKISPVTTMKVFFEGWVHNVGNDGQLPRIKSTIKNERNFDWIRSVYEAESMKVTFYKF